MSNMRNFRDYLIERLQDPGEAAVYLKIALEEYEKDGHAEAFLLALRSVVEAMGGISELAKRTNLNRQNLYRALSGKGNPKWSTLGTILSGLGFRFSIESNADFARNRKIHCRT
jgi:probable addiction module antidote protein